MKRLIGAAVITAGLAFGGTTVAGATQSPRTRIFLTAIHSVGIPRSKDKASLKLAHTFCAEADTVGFDSAFLQVVRNAAKLGETAKQARQLGEVIGAGVVAFCPAYTADAVALSQTKVA